MQDSHAFLQNLALVLCVAAATTVVFQRLRQPVVFGYLLTGMIVGPHIPLPLLADQETVRTLAELGVVLLMFSLGLEFSLRRVLQVGPTAGLAALAETSVMAWLGYVLGQLFGWTTLESLYAGAIIAISSTTIIVKALADQGVRGKFTDVVFGILVFEDLIAILLVAALTAISSGGGLSAGSLAATGVRLTTFLVGLAGFGLLVIPRFMRAVVRLNRAETTLVASMGVCFAAALLAAAFGYSVALGAFIAGSLVAESGEERTIQQLIQPVRDMFVAIFFVAVGMLIDPSVILRHWDAVVAFTLAVVTGKVVAVSVGVFLTGHGPRTSVQTGMSLAQIGEFSFIIAAVGLATGATRDFLYPIAVAVSAVTTLFTPWLIQAAGPVAMFVDRKLPKPLQTWVALYGSWIERLRSAPKESGRSEIRRLVRVLLIDAVMLAAVVIGAAMEMGRFTTLLSAWTGISDVGARLVIIAGAVLVGVPLLYGLIRSARLLGRALAVRALPAVREGRVDLAAAPRRVLVVSLQLAILFAVSVPLVAVTQPFLPPLRGAAILAILLGLLGIAFWRSATNLQGHARAGAEMIVAVLAQRMARAEEPEELSRTLERVDTVLPGLGSPVPVHIGADSPAVDKTLAQLNLRGLTGATVLAIIREGERVLVPTGREVVRAGDVLVIAGTHDAESAARELLSVEAPRSQQTAVATVEDGELTAPGSFSRE